MSKVPMASPEQWKHIQGGKPFIIGNEPSTVFKICHVYNDTGDFRDFDPDIAARYSHYGVIVTSTVRDLNNSLNRPTQVLIGSDAVEAPPAMRYDLHGRPCTIRSGRRNYDTARSQSEWTSYLQAKAGEEWDIWDIEKNNGSLKLSLRGLLSSALDVR